MAGAGRKVDNQVNMHRDGNGGLTVDQMLGEASQSDIFGLNYVDLLTRLQTDLVPTAGINGVPVDIGSSSIPDGSSFTYDTASGAFVLESNEKSARAYLTAATTIGTGLTILPVNVLSWNDAAGGMDIVNHWFSVTTPGDYLCIGNVFTQASGLYLQPCIVHNGAIVAVTSFLEGAGASINAFPVSDIVRCVAGDTLQLGAQSVGGNSALNVAAGSILNYFSVARIA